MLLTEVGAQRKTVLITGYTDLRKGIDGLAGLLLADLDCDPCSGALYLFCGRRASRIKILCWDSDRGFVLLYARLEKGRFRWPRKTRKALELTSEQYEHLMAGFEYEEHSTIHTVTNRNLF